ncbi:daptide biosynthesis RiPP recognition protein [Arthrobacter sp. RAF14]|uniref:daptide biosynthesis RiPP recognition protein n=1 Tax=Arthrobacter sp. RAF14 TaxID=3233051 RepID=UPI003F928441
MQEKLAVQALEQWVVGSVRPGAKHAFIEYGVDPEVASDALPKVDVAFVPAGSSIAGDHRMAVEYDGALSAPGDQLFLDGQVVEVQDYVASGFVDVLGPTVVHLSGDDGWAALVEDAEAALQLGVFPEHLLNPSVLLADRFPLLDLAAATRPSRFYCKAGGSTAFGMQGGDLDIADLAECETVSELPAWAAISGVVTERTLDRDQMRFASVGRFVGAVELLRSLKLVPADIDLVGFGMSLVADDRADAVVCGREPFLTRQGGEYLLLNQETRSRHRLSRDTAGLVEIIQSSSSLELAIDRACRTLAASSESVAQGLLQVQQSLKVSVAVPGQPVGAIK